MVIFCAVLVALALATQIGKVVIERTYPPQGRIIDVAGGSVQVLELGARDAAGPPIVMLHGASSNLGAMRLPLGDLLAQRHRVILIDRPGHGWSSRDDLKDSPPAVQARMIDEALGTLGVGGAIVVAHSMAGALAALMALDYPERTRGLVMLAPATHPWPGGVGTYNKILTMPLIGPLLAYTITLPIGLALVDPGARGVFLPQTMPPNYVKASATPLLLRPREFLANAWDLITLKEAVRAQAPRYPQIKVPTVIISGDSDSVASIDIHSRAFAAAVPNAKLMILPNVGHMVQNAAPDLVITEIEAMIAGFDTKPQAAMR